MNCTLIQEGCSFEYLLLLFIVVDKMDDSLVDHYNILATRIRDLLEHRIPYLGADGHELSDSLFGSY